MNLDVANHPALIQDRYSSFIAGIVEDYLSFKKSNHYLIAAILIKI